MPGYCDPWPVNSHPAEIPRATPDMALRLVSSDGGLAQRGGGLVAVVRADREPVAPGRLDPVARPGELAEPLGGAGAEVVGQPRGRAAEAVTARR